LSKHSQQAVELFKQGYNCSQSVFAAFHNDMDMNFDTALKLSSSFGGGMGRLREVCGAVSGMFMVVGMKYGYTDPKNRQVKTEHYKLIQMLADRFKAENNSIICRELLGLNIKIDSPVPELRTGDYYTKRPCVELVECAARLIDEFIKNKEMEECI
jgi:C_GCAxxG_C_C family probable redox protein